GLRSGRHRRAAHRDRPGARAPAAALGSYRHAAGGRLAGRDRAGAAAPPAAVDGDLRQDRHRGSARAGPALARCCRMSPLRKALADYLTIRRSLGYRLARPEKLLAQFIIYLEDAGAETVTTAHALAWAMLPAGNPSWHALRLSAVRGFATYLHTIDPSAEVPPANLIPWRPCRATPYLYSATDIAALIAAAASLRFPLRAATYQTLIGLLAVTGMRVGEAIRLDRPDADLDAGVLTICQSKFGKSRLVPLHPTTVDALRGYLRLRDQLHPRPGTPAVFISPAGTRLMYCNVHSTFQRLARQAGLQPRS